MAFTYTCTGVKDQITDLIVEDNFNIKVVFKINGSFRVNKIMNDVAYSSVKKMESGQQVLVATCHGRLMWVKPLQPR